MMSMFQNQIVRLIPCFLALLLALPSGETAAVTTTRDDLKISYALTVTDPARGEVEVSVLIEHAPQAEVVLVLPCWAPGRFIRDDFAALVTGESARLDGGGELPIERIGSHVYRLDTGGASVLFSYRIRAGRATTGSSLVEARGALLNPASLLPYVRGSRDAEVGVYLSGPASWRWTSSLRSEGVPGRFRAPNWDTLARAPIFGGAFAERMIEHEGLRLNLVVLAADSSLSTTAGLALEALLPAARAMIGAAAAKEATIFIHALEPDTESGFRAGDDFALVVLDQKSDEVELLDRLAAATVALIAGDAMQPARGGLNDMTDLPVRDDLWVAPALSRYLGLHLLRRAGIIGEAELLAKLAGMAEAADMETSGRAMNLLDAARRMALRRADDPRRLPDDQAAGWFDPIRRGELAALVLDLHLRALSNGKKGLVDALRDLVRRREEFSLARLRRAVEEQGGRLAGAFFDTLLTEKAYPNQRALAAEAGFQFEFESSSVGLGLELEGDRVVSVRPGSAAAKAGIQVRDRIVRLDGRAIGNDAGERIAAMPSGKRTTVTVERRGGIVTLPLAVEGLRRAGWRLVATEDETVEPIRAGFLGREKGE